MIEFEDACYSYPDGTTALKNINIHISKGEKVAIVGNNGSGKTTFALHINGILMATSGRVLINGLDPSNGEDSKILKQKVGLVFQNPDNQLVATTVEREIAFSLENLNIPHPEIKDRVDRVLRFFGLSDFRQRLTSDLSGGEKQKLALASVMVSEPEILILDEPGSYLDESGKRLLDDAISLLLKEKEDLTVLRVTQYALVAERYNRMIAFKDGAIVADGKPDEIFYDFNLGKLTGVGIPLKYRIKMALNQPGTDSESLKSRKTDRVNAKSIVVDSVSFGYDGKYSDYLFDKFDLTIESDRIYGLVGPSGGGKTTLIQLMAGLLKPNSGTVAYHGFEPKPGKLAVSFQQSERQFFLETVDREIRFGAKNLALNDVDNIADKCYLIVGLDKKRYADRNPFTLSGGEKRRLAFGTILSLKPMFIFFDEPTCALDSEGIGLFRKMVTKLKADNIGIVIVSHYGDIIFELADEVIVLDNGRIDSINSKKDFFEQISFSDYLSVPEAVAYQADRFGEIRYFSETELLSNI